MAAPLPLIVCWLDKAIGEDGAYLPLKQQFQSVSNRITEWKYFDCTDTFIEFVDSHPNTHIVVIMSGSFAKQVVSPISDRNTLHSVYVFCGNRQKYQYLTSNEPKIRAVFDSEDALRLRLRDDLQREFP